MSNAFYVKITGAKQGLFTSEAYDPGGSPMTSLGLGFEYSVMVPVAVSTGMASGKRQHSPVVFTKAWGAASPQLFQALVGNELLPTVQFVFWKPNSDDNPDEFYTITLSTARVSKIEQYENFNATGHQDANDERFLEDVSLTFQQIEVKNLNPLIVASDGLSAR